MLTYPDKPKTDRFFDGYGYKPVKQIISWEWSTTFGKWGATVEFSDGSTLYTFPENKPSDPHYCTLTIEQAKALQPGTILYAVHNFNRKAEPQRWKVNGQVKTWRRDPSRVQVPVKHGLYAHGYVTEANLTEVTLSEQYAKDNRGS